MEIHKNLCAGHSRPMKVFLRLDKSEYRRVTRVSPNGRRYEKATKVKF